MLSMLPEYLFQERRVNCSLTEVGTFRWCSLLSSLPFSLTGERECVCVCTHVCVHVRAHTGVHEHTHTYINTYTHIHTLSHACTLSFSLPGGRVTHAHLAPPHTFLENVFKTHECTAI